MFDNKPDSACPKHGAALCVCCRLDDELMGLDIEAVRRQPQSLQAGLDVAKTELRPRHLEPHLLQRLEPEKRAQANERYET